jgi:hypothetical protein
MRPVRRLSRLLRVVVIPAAALSILLFSSLPANAASATTTKHTTTVQTAKPLSMNW